MSQEDVATDFVDSLTFSQASELYVRGFDGNVSISVGQIAMKFVLSCCPQDELWGPLNCSSGVIIRLNI